MQQPYCRFLSLVIVLVLSTQAWSQVWIEVGDAGALPGQDQAVFGAGPLFAIQGNTGPGDDVDMYAVWVDDPDNFVVATNPGAGGFADFDTQLFVFDEFGNGIAANDDCPFEPGTQSCIANIGPFGQGFMNNPGLYFIAVSGYDNDPFSQAGQIFDQNPFTEITGPDGPGGFQPINNWNFGGDNGNYDLALQGVSFIVPPVLYEPGVKHEPPAAPCECECATCPDDSAATLEIDPVYLFSGEFYLDAEDLRISGRGIDFVWARKYRSRLGPNTAQGNNWDFSYNISIQQFGPDLLLCNGHSREDLYADQGNGTWSAPEFFQVFSQNPDTSYTLTFPDTGSWSFFPLDGSPQEGKISQIADRNGNALTFEYDPSGQLTTIRDTLDSPGNPRAITIGYNADGFIDSVTDFTGRTVTYEYYEDGDAGGSAGDLKSVTTPAVTGTPHGNDFPSGKTTTYTYSTGFGDPQLNHNLLTITDPKGQLWLSNVYATTTNPNDVNFDRITRQYWGDQDPLTGDIVDVVYVPQVPDPSNNFAVIMVILNDRVGNVSEFFYDFQNRGVIQLDYTGRADPDQPTTENVNRPTGKLRASDPNFFETRLEHNGDGQTTRIVHPNGNEDVFIFDEANPDRRAQGNMLEHMEVAGPLGGDQASISETFEYDQGFGGCCGTNFVTRHVDGRGNETTHIYDSAGNRTQSTHRLPSIVEDFEYNAFGQLTAHVHPDNGSSHRRRDELSYYAAGAQTGYLQSKVVDAPNFALATTFEYDAVGNVTRMTDPRGNDTQYVHNALDQVVRETSREVTGGSGIRYAKDTYYDANDNVIRVDVENKDDAGVLQANTHFSTIHEYDILNNLLRTCGEVGTIVLGPADLDCGAMPQSDAIVTEIEYDANRNQVLRRMGEATNGNQPANTVSTLFDERDLVFQEVRAQGDPDQSTLQIDYDGNKNRVAMHQGLEGTPRTTLFVFDGYNRLVSSTDPMGNVSTSHYDENDNRTSFDLQGEEDDIAGSAGNVRLYGQSYQYDAMDRVTRAAVEFFDTATQVVIGDGQSVLETFYSDNSQVVRTVDDNSHETLSTYDTANRVLVVTDPKLNTMTYGYDANSNVVSVTEVEKSDLSNPDETFVTTHDYDGLDRLTRKVDNVANEINQGHDSRNNQTMVTDANNNETRLSYDGINRLIRTTRDMDGDGADGDGDDIVTIQSWDDSSRPVSMTDDSGNVSTYTYDALNRITREDCEDGTFSSSVYDAHDNKVSSTDANGTATTITYDLLDRVTNKTIAVGPGVSNDTSFETYRYDGLRRVIRLEDDDSIVVRSYDSLSRVTSETLNGETTTHAFDGVGNNSSSVYPGGRTITRAFDDLDRISSISDGGGSIAGYDYIGPGRMERREYGNGTRTDYAYDGILPNPPGDLGVKQIVRTTHSLIAGGTILDDRTYTWDAMRNKIQRADVRAGGPQLTHDYGYDPIYRLTQADVTDPVDTIRNTTYDYDGVGNRILVTGGPDAGPYSLDATAPQPADQQLNQYSATPFDRRTYDANGNLIAGSECIEGDANDDEVVDINDVGQFVAALLSGGVATCEVDLNKDGTANGLDLQPFVDRILGVSQPVPDFEMKYDSRNRMVEYADNVSGVRHTYAYDAYGRRIVRINDADGAATETRYFYDGWQVCEEQDSNGATQATYVYGMYIDEVLNMQRGGANHYFHADDLYNVVAVSDSAGSVVERYEYQDHGDPEFTDGNGLPLAGTAIGNPYLFNGRRYDDESSWYYYRTRYLDPRAGRFTTRDTIGMWGDEVNVGNGYTHVGNSPATHLDPFGEAVDASALAYRIMLKLKNRRGGATSMCGRIGNAKLMGFARSIGVTVMTAPLKTIAGQGFFGQTAKAIADGIDKIEDAKDKVDKLRSAIRAAIGGGTYKVVRARRVIGSGPCMCSMSLVLNTRTGKYQAFFRAVTGTKGDQCCPPHTITHFRVQGTAKMVRKPWYIFKQLSWDHSVRIDKVQTVHR